MNGEYIYIVQRVGGKRLNPLRLPRHGHRDAIKSVWPQNDQAGHFQIRLDGAPGGTLWSSSHWMLGFVAHAKCKEQVDWSFSWDNTSLHFAAKLQPSGRLLLFAAVMLQLIWP